MIIAETNLTVALPISKWTTLKWNRFQTPNFLTEYDGNGLNLALRVPVLRSYQMNFCITNFEKS